MMRGDERSTVTINAGIPAAVLTATEVTKSFGAIRALNGVSFDVLAGEVHALVGENGAGKSTLIRVMTGEDVADGGTLRIGGRTWSDLTPAIAHRLGIRVVHQEPSLFPDLTVSENLALGVETMRPWQRIDRAARRTRAASLLARIGGTIDPDRLAGSLTTPEQQLVEIARALGAEARVLVFDEPTASLTTVEVRALFDTIRRLRRDGVAIVYISHRLEEVTAIADRVTVLRDGRSVGTLPAQGLAVRDLVAMMVGDTAPVTRPPERPLGPVALEVRHLSCAAAGIRDVSLTVRQGEVVGLAGVVGSGRTQLAETIFGITAADAGEVLVNGIRRAVRSPADARRCGIAYVPEDRRRHGVILDMSVVANTTLASLDAVSRHGVTRRDAELAAAARYIDQLQIKTASPLDHVSALSGGNQQKVAVARWLMTQPTLLILDEPTQGVDVRSKWELHRLVGELAAQGLAVLVISSDIHEVLALSDRVAVMRGGTIVGHLPRHEASPHAVLALALGAAPAPLEESTW
jgi:rhamnose transport system ATP-binding protein